MVKQGNPSMVIMYKGINAFSGFYLPENNWDKFKEYRPHDREWAVKATEDSITWNLKLFGKKILGAEIYIDEDDFFIQELEQDIQFKFPFSVICRKMETR